MKLTYLTMECIEDHARLEAFRKTSPNSGIKRQKQHESGIRTIPLVENLMRQEAERKYRRFALQSCQ